MKHFSTLATGVILSIAFSGDVTALGSDNLQPKPDLSITDAVVIA